MTTKFKIGDEVCFIGTKGKKKKRQWFVKDKEDVSFEAAQVFRVTDVIVETCYGGVQIHYNLRPMGYGHDDVSCSEGPVAVHKDLFKAREIELEAK